MNGGGTAERNGRFNEKQGTGSGKKKLGGVTPLRKKKLPDIEREGKSGSERNIGRQTFSLTHISTQKRRKR